MTVMFAHSSSSSSSPPDNPRPYMQDGCVLPQSPPPYGMFQSAGYGRQQQGYGMQQQGYGMPQQQGYGMPQQQGYGMQQQQGFGMPQQQGPYGQEKPPDYGKIRRCPIRTRAMCILTAPSHGWNQFVLLTLGLLLQSGIFDIILLSMNKIGYDH